MRSTTVPVTIGTGNESSCRATRFRHWGGWPGLFCLLFLAHPYVSAFSWHQPYSREQFSAGGLSCRSPYYRHVVRIAFGLLSCVAPGWNRVVPGMPGATRGFR
jgi:hypothetical protein